MRRPGISYRVSLLTVIALLVLVTSGSIALFSYSSGKDAVQTLARDLFREVSRQTVVMTSDELRRAAPASETLLLLLGREGLRSDRDAMGRAFVEMLRANPDFSWVNFCDREGSCTSAHRAAGSRIIMSLNTIVDGKSQLDEYDVDAADHPTLFRHQGDNHFDPRKRPFWRVADEQRRRAWAPPYVFFDEGVQGISCATPVLDGGSGMAGVITIDFDLNSLSKFVATQQISKNGRVFIYAPDATVIAHPTVRILEREGHGGEGSLVTMTAIEDPIARAYYAAATATKRGEAESPSPSPSPTRVFHFEYEGKPFFGSATSFAIDENLQWIAGAYAPESDFMESMRANNVTTLVVSGVGVLFALLVSVALANRIAVPLTRLAGEMNEVGRFELADRPIAGSLFREIAMMNDALLGMKRGLRSFANYVPRDVVRAVLSSGQEAVLGGKTRELTVFFSDIAGFTTVAETMKPDELVGMLGEYLDEMTRILVAHGGTVDKYLGDGIMAFWGAPVENASHAALACEAALACTRRLEELRVLALRPWAIRWKTRIGIATGEALVGNIGTPERMNYTVMGDTANLAARLEGLNKMYGSSILVSESTYRAAEGRVIGRPVDVAAVKGKKLGIKVFELLSTSSEKDDASAAVAAASTRALDAYLARDFAAAVLAWGEVLTLRPGDVSAETMLARARAHIASPPPPDWTGVHVMETK